MALHLRNPHAARASSTGRVRGRKERREGSEGEDGVEATAFSPDAKRQLLCLIGLPCGCAPSSCGRFGYAVDFSNVIEFSERLESSGCAVRWLVCFSFTKQVSQCDLSQTHPSFPSDLSAAQLNQKCVPPSNWISIAMSPGTKRAVPLE